MKKIDVHIHCAPRRMPRENPRNSQAAYVADPQEMRRHLQEQGVGRAVLMSGGEDAAGVLPGTSNRDCQMIVRREPGFFAWMCNVDPVSPETLPHRLAAYKAQGAVGVGELTVNQWIDGPFLTALFAAAQQTDLPVLFHMSPEPGFAYGICDKPGLPLLEQALRRFPALKLVGHSQMFWLELSADCPRHDSRARCGFGRGPVVPGGRVERLMRAYPNLYGDLSAYSGSCAILRDEAYGLAFLEEFSERLFFGTDTINQQNKFPLGAFLDRSLEDGRLSRRAWENICWRNAQRVFGL